MSKRDIKRALKSVKAQLSGTGAPYGERSRWGMIETLPMRVIAQIRQFVTGPEQTFDANFDFIGLTTNLDEDSQLKLIALADMLRENQAIYLAVIEGQANQFGNPEEDQILSRARASAVRELLIKRGIATERVVAYGIGNALTSAHRKGKSTHTKPITIRYYEGKPRQRLAATRWDELAIVKHEGHVEHIVDGRKHQLEERSQIPANGIVRLQAGSRVLLRAPDGSTIFLVGPSAIEFIEGSFSGPVKRLDARLLEGEVIVRNDPSRSRKSQFSLSFGRHHHLAAGSTTFRAGTDGVRLWLTIDKGRVQLKRTKGDTLTLGDGQSYLALESARTVWPQKPEPMVLGLGGSQKKGRSTLRWKGAAPDTGYRVEFADSADFTWVVARKVITANELNIDETIPKAAKFWRVARIDERGIPGRFSAVYPIETPLRYQNAKP
ncbi:MAG: OmpA family protein [Bradymonadia bacterium]